MLRPEGERRGLVTVRPSYLLRIRDGEAKGREYSAFKRDMKMAADLL